MHKVLATRVIKNYRTAALLKFRTRLGFKQRC